MFFKRFRSKSSRQSRPSQVRKPRGRLGVERLEDRLMMFGDAIGTDVDSLASQTDDLTTDVREYLSGSNVPQLSSDPDATHTLYLDFDGYEYLGLISGRVNPYVPAFSMDDNYKALNKQELQVIEETWSWVSEDFSPFDINVTTVDPGQKAFDNNLALRVAIGGYGEWYGDDPISGVSLGNPFFDDFTPNVVWTFSEEIQDRAEILNKFDGDGRDVLFQPYLANTISHEAGHAFGLAHHGEWDEAGVKTAEYTGGEELRTPIMGSNRARDRATWDVTELMKYQRDDDGNILENAEGKKLYEFAKIQDDMEVLADTLGFRTDDHDATLDAAPDLVRSGISSVSQAGVIEKISDADWFRFSTTGGNVHLSVDVLEDMTDLNSDGVDNDEDGVTDEGDEYDWGGANLDVRIEIYRINNEVTGDMTFIAAADPGDRLGAEFSGSLISGDYVLMVMSHGHHGDAGQYTISGSIPRLSIEIPTVPEFWPSDQRELPGIDPRVDPRLTLPLKQEFVVAQSKPIATATKAEAIVSVGVNTNVEFKGSMTTLMKKVSSRNTLIGLSKYGTTKLGR